MHHKMAAETVLPPPPPPPLDTRSSQAAAGLSYLTNSALQLHSHNQAQTSSVIPTRERVPWREPRPPDTRSLPDVESFLSNTRYQTRDGTVVTEPLRNRLKPVLVTRQPYKQLPSRVMNIPDAIQTKTPVQTGVLPTKDPILRQMEEQQTVVLQHTWEVEQMRQQKQYLQALIHIDAQVSGCITIFLTTDSKWIDGLSTFIRQSRLQRPHLKRMCPGMLVNFVAVYLSLC